MAVAGFYLGAQAHTCLGLGILAGHSVHMVLLRRPPESCHHQCLQAVCGVFGYPRGAAMELLDGTLKLRHCTRLFSNDFHPLSFTMVWVGLMEVVKGLLLHLVISWIVGVTLVNGSG